MARAPSASSVVAPTRSRPSRMVNGICADATVSAPADSAGSTICRSLMSSVAWPPSLARIATSKARGSSPAMRGGFQRHGAAARTARRSAPSAAALARQRHLQRRAARGHRQGAIAQGRAIDAVELRCAHSAQIRSRRACASMLAVASPPPMPPLMRVEGQRLAVALEGAADRPQFAAARQHAAQRLKRDLAAPAFHKSRAERLRRIVAGGADRERKGRREIERIEADFAVDVVSPSSVSARRPRSREPAIAPSISSKVSLLPASDTRDDRLIFCASLSDGLRSNSGARLTCDLQIDVGLRRPPPRDRRCLVPRRRARCPVRLRFSRSGARHTPVTDPSNCAGPSPAAIARSSPSRASSDAPCSDASLVSMVTSLRRSCRDRRRAPPRSRPGRDRRDALELRRIEIERGARIGAIGMARILVDGERKLQPRRARTGSMALSRAASDGANGAIEP